MNICLFTEEELGKPLLRKDERNEHIIKVLHKKEGDSFDAGIIGKMSGIGVKEFSIGLGPTLFGVRRGETLYSIKLFPFGGITIFEGEDPDEADSPKSFRKAFRLPGAMSGT